MMQLVRLWHRPRPERHTKCRLTTAVAPRACVGHTQQSMVNRATSSLSERSRPTMRLIPVVSVLSVAVLSGSMQVSRRPAKPRAGTSRIVRASRDAAAGHDWTQFGFDLARSSAAPTPTGITAANVASMRRQQVSIDGTVDATAIYLSGVRVNDATHNVLVVTTTYGKTIALDANGGGVLWEYTPPGFDGWVGSDASPTQHRSRTRTVRRVCGVAEDATEKCGEQRVRRSSALSRASRGGRRSGVGLMLPIFGLAHDLAGDVAGLPLTSAMIGCSPGVGLSDVRELAVEQGGRHEVLVPCRPCAGGSARGIPSCRRAPRHGGRR